MTEPWRSAGLLEECLPDSDCEGRIARTSSGGAYTIINHQENYDMSIVIIGGNECMERRYKEVCKRHGCDVKVFCKFKGGMKDRIGSPDLMILFTHTVSHKMVQYALNETAENTRVVRSHTSSISSLDQILAEHAG